MVLDIDGPFQRASVHSQLATCAYSFVRPADDQIHDGVYTRNARDHAEKAREFLLASLVNTPGPEAYSAVLELADKREFERVADRLRLMARNRAAADADFPRYSSQDVVALDSRYEVPPGDRSGLFAVVMDRLRDIAYELAHHDFSDRLTVKRISKEMEMQRTLALRLESRSNGAYLITREEEVADQKRTDIRFSTPNGQHKAVVEVKIADNGWTMKTLEKALRDQLVGRYLRHAQCKAGCLLLTYHGEKKYWIHPESGRRLTFQEVVESLSHTAQILESENMHDVRVSVFGLDLTSPQETILEIYGGPAALMMT